MLTGLVVFAIVPVVPSSVPSDGAGRQGRLGAQVEAERSAALVKPTSVVGVMMADEICVGAAMWPPTYDRTRCSLAAPMSVQTGRSRRRDPEVDGVPPMNTKSSR
jgi:hypothetical protein